LPSEIISVIRYHHTPDAPDAPRNQPLIRMVYIAEKILPSFGMVEHVNPGISDSDWEALSIVPANAEEILTQAAEQADQATLFAANLETFDVPAICRIVERTPCCGKSLMQISSSAEY
jgi:hypothetical protein